MIFFLIQILHIFTKKLLSTGIKFFNVPESQSSKIFSVGSKNGTDFAKLMGDLGYLES